MKCQKKNAHKTLITNQCTKHTAVIKNFRTQHIAFTALNI